jgi:hypothetical protein
VDLVQNTKQGEKISPELELMILEQRLMDPKLSTSKMIKKFDLKCSQSNVQKIYKRWGLARFNQPVVLRGVISQPIAEKETIEQESVESVGSVLSSYSILHTPYSILHTPYSTGKVGKNLLNPVSLS